MRVVEENQSLLLYPNVSKVGSFDAVSSPAVLVTNNSVSVSLTHRRINGEGKWQLVPFYQMNKTELQEYIDTLQGICNRLT